jgi:hypothetical protein
MIAIDAAQLDLIVGGADDAPCQAARTAETEALSELGVDSVRTGREAQKRTGLAYLFGGFGDGAREMKLRQAAGKATWARQQACGK